MEFGSGQRQVAWVCGLTGYVANPTLLTYLRDRTLRNVLQYYVLLAFVAAFLPTVELLLESRQNFRKLGSNSLKCM